MTEAMRHEKHYSGGQHAIPELGLYVGWMGHKGAFGDCMPLVSRQQDVVLFFQGENYLDDETRARLNRSGAGVDDSNTRYLLDLYAEYGEEFFLRLNGWFSGVVADLRKKNITLFNDRYGMGRIYFYEGKDEFIFGSEAKSLLKVRPELRAIEPSALAEHLRYNCVLNNRSLFKNVSTLPHAAAWEFEGSVVPRKRSYFNFGEWEQQPRLSAAEFFPKFADTLSRVFPAYGRSSSKVAFSLTAGLDTRAIMAALKEQNRGMPCYTFGGPWRELYDISTARKLTQIFGQPFDTIKADGRFLKGFPDYARRAVHVSDGTHDVFGAHDIYFNEIARETALVRLTGKFGSEVVRIRNLVPSMTYPAGVIRPEIGAMVEGLPHFAQVSRDLHPLTRVVTQEIPWAEFGRVAVEQSQVVLRSPYMDNELVKLMYQAPVSTRGEGDLQEQYVKERSPELATIPTNLGRFAGGGRLANKLHYGPLWALFKVEYIYLYATPHWMTRIDRALEGLRLERFFAGRQKWEGYRIWLKTDFADFVRQTLLDPGAGYADFFERSAIEKMVMRHTAGTHNYLNEINRALSVELICSSLLRA
jgi:asparagine synthase (glutamine-hydrolysing)